MQMEISEIHRLLKPIFAMIFFQENPFYPVIGFAYIELQSHQSHLTSTLGL